MIYEFQCTKGHVTEASVPMGTTEWPCEGCIAEMKATQKTYAPFPWAKRILSPTRTTFHFADRYKS